MSDASDHALRAPAEMHFVDPADDVAAAMLDLFVATASGRPIRDELNGEREIAIWKTGVTL